MKSLLISSLYFPPKVGGISHLMGDITSALGPDRVCCLTSQLANGAGVRECFGSTVYRRPAVFGAKAKGLRAAAWGATIAEIMLRERPEIVQAATTGDAQLALWLRRWLKLPFVVYAHGNEILDGMQVNGGETQLALKQADRVLAVSRFTASLVQKLGVDAARIEVVHPGCDSDRFRPVPPRIDLRQKLLGARYKRRVILTVGALVVRKGHDMVIRALPKVCQAVPEVAYLIVGNGPCRSRLEALAADVGVRDHVIFAGRVEDEQMSDIYTMSDVFVMPSREILEAGTVEGFGLVFLEASACAKPVVGGRSGGIPDAVVDGVTGLLVDPQDPEDIANALTRLLTDREVANRLGRQGRARVVEDFNWPRVADRLQGLLESVIEESSIRQ
jgi:phosphatidylinositol alpha-1,6-mannosyltransferase